MGERCHRSKKKIKNNELLIYRDSKGGPCEICMHLRDDWDGRVVDESVVYNNGFQTD